MRPAGAVQQPGFYARPVVLCSLPYDPCSEASVYGGNYLNPVQRPLVEWGMPLYLNGPVPPPTLEFGTTNPSVKRFYVYGDYRAAAAYINQNGTDQGVLANRLNLELDYWMTATERIHGSIGPFQDGNEFMRRPVCQWSRSIS